MDPSVLHTPDHQWCRRFKDMDPSVLHISDWSSIVDVMSQNNIILGILPHLVKSWSATLNFLLVIVTITCLSGSLTLHLCHARFTITAIQLGSLTLQLCYARFTITAIQLGSLTLQLCYARFTITAIQLDSLTLQLCYARFTNLTVMPWQVHH